MKKSILIFYSLVTLLLVACKKTDIHNTDEEIGVSKVTHFAVLTLNGERYTTIAVGSAFTDPGIVAKEGSADIMYTTTGSVNTNVPGVYILTYSSINKDGFPASITRTVTVYSTDGVAAANDYSGTYLRTATGFASSWTKLAPGVYLVTNPGGASVGTSTSVIVFNSSGNNIHMPSQQISDGSEMTSSDEIYTQGAPSKYVWKILNAPTYGTGLRTFIKQ
jgi:hypothetical protein